MVQVSPDSQTSWVLKFCESTLATIALLNLLLIPLQFLPPTFFEQYGQYFGFLLLAIVIVAVLTSLIYAWVWHRREQSNRINSPLHHAWLQGFIRYWLALSIATYGFAKLLKTQFQTPTYLLDVPLSELSGMDLTWFYFGFSYPFAVVVALFQLAGAILLLYRRTTLLGVMILLPVMINIVLINLFYKISPGAFFNSIVFTLALVFLMLLQGKRLKSIFWNVVDQLPGILSGHRWLKHSLRLLPLAIAFISLNVLIDTHPYDQTLKGRWKVEKLIRNGQVQPPTAWLTDARVWSRVYFSGLEGCAFSPNPYRFDASESLVGSYEFDSLHNKLEVAFYSRDTLRASVSHRTAKAMRLYGVLGRDTLDMQLARILR